MSSQINDLVNMRDVESLYELMTEDDDWMNQLDAAEGLVKLGDRRGYDFLISASQSEDKEIREDAKEILDSPDLARMISDLDAEAEREHQERVETARKRLQKGRKVFRYKMIYLAAGEILSDDTSIDGFEVPGLEDIGLEGWEVVNIIPRRGAVLVGSADDHFIGAYFLLKREVDSEESADLK
ncbi:MAG TPA: hypothetical protein VMT73_01740 [Anaerolineales bacterium]|nr:hypothetical protein [Anaerolineales bacterium]